MTQATNKTITISLNTTKQLQGSGAMTQATAQKGRLEHLLDDFTEVHGTVLLGMHKELQTLKKDVEEQLESRLKEFLDEVGAAESDLSKEVGDAERLAILLRCETEVHLDRITAKCRETISALDLAGEATQAQNSEILTQAAATLATLGALSANARDALRKDHQNLESNLRETAIQSSTQLAKVRDSSMASLQGFATALNAAQTTFSRDTSARLDQVKEIQQGIAESQMVAREDLSAHSKVLQQRLSATHEAALREVFAHCQSVATKVSDVAAASKNEILIGRDAALADIKTILDTVAQRNVAFREAASIVQQNMQKAHAASQKKMAEALRIAQAINEENRVLVSELREQQTSLHQRELQMQKRTRQLALGAGLVVLSTLGFWTWITLTH
ncbi:hypothetical protein [Candidatus Accumulibacter vicinus]|uniref:Uncharacterized protein n=1 Tax=Candidatus Accumulibacter vicinus TaxID=2954382 RepID=A0A084Y3I7_9PROT|nr:hypothetical protein [Candidatus Accumulibacter vicinus]KFB69281.1 MAG: hypothetical protein CAPSK01_001026 [Candidatus Accumulibacter vicinus]